MSIESSIAAEHSEMKRKEWLRELKKAYDHEDWGAILELIIKIKDYRFTE